MVLLFLCGALSILAQVILLRELVAAFYGVDLIYLLALGAWLLWTAVGALIGRRVLAPSANRVAAVLIAAGALVPLDLLVVRRLRLLLGGVPGAFLPLPEQVAGSVLCLMPPSLLLGLLFQLAAKRYLDAPSAAGAVGGAMDSVRGARRRTLARAYAVESGGAMVAGLLTTCAVSWQIQNAVLALATAALASVVAIAALRRDAGLLPRVDDPHASSSRHLHTPLLAIASLVIVACGIALAQPRRFDLLTAAWNHPGVIETVDTPYGRATITERSGQVALYENDALVFDSEGTAAEELAHLSLVQHPSPGRVLLIESASAGILPYVAAHGAERIDALEGDRRLVELLARRLPTPFRSALSLPAVHVVFDDPRRAIAGCLTLPCGDRYDVIVIAAAEPSSAQANRYFTREFFAHCAARLSPGGVVSLRLPSVENFWTPQVAARAGAIYAALTEVFADVVVLPGSTNIVVASPGRLSRDPAALSDRLVSRGIHASLVTPRYVRYLYSNDRFAEIEQTLRRATLSNTDAHPASYQATALLWVSKFVPAAGMWDLTWVQQEFGWQSRWPWLTLAVLAGAAYWFGTRHRVGGAGIVAIAAAAGMGLETVLLVHYQLKHGVVFRDLGVLLMSVMGGLAAGALAAERLRAGSRARGGWWTRSVLVSFAALSIASALAIRSGFDAGLAISSLALAATGAVVAFVFAVAAASSTEDPRRLVSPLYAADVLGGAVGSIVASLVLIPLVGLPAASAWAAATAAIGVLAVPRRG